MTRLLHADDAGLSLAINEAILSLLRENRLESLSVISNAPHAEHFMGRLIGLWPKLTSPPHIFLHLNLVEAKPLTPWPRKMLQESGEFAGYERLIQELLAGRVEPSVIEAELEAQFEQLQASGLPVHGIDSHQHMHALSPVAEIVRDFASRHHLAVRSYDDMVCQTWIGQMKKHLLSWAARFTAWRYFGAFTLPPSWREHTWRPFAMASWERVAYHRLGEDELIACHPGSWCDRGFEP